VMLSKVKVRYLVKVLGEMWIFIGVLMETT